MVLAERKGVARPVRTVVDIQEGTGVGELLRSNLIGSQLAVALRFAIGAGLTLGLLPVLFAMFPEIGLLDVFGLRLPWLLLGFLVYPFLLGLGWWHTRTAERWSRSSPTTSRTTDLGPPPAAPRSAAADRPDLDADVALPAIVGG